MVLTFSPDEIELVKKVLHEDGYDDDLKNWILDNMLTDENEHAGAADRVIENVATFVKENPDTIRAAGTIAGNLFGRIIKKGPRR